MGDISSQDEKRGAIAPATTDAAESHFWGDLGFNGLTDDVWAERRRQLKKRGVQERASGHSAAVFGEHEAIARRAYEEALAAGKLTWLHILNEEVMEAFAADTVEHCREELVQVMAVAASWILDLDRRGDAPVRNAAQEELDAQEIKAT